MMLEEYHLYEKQANSRGYNYENMQRELIPVVFAAGN